MRILLAILVVGATGDATALGHSAHTQVTEVEWNPVSGRFEVAIKLNAVALEDSISVSQGKRFRLESSPTADAVLAKWLPRSFRIFTDKASRPGTIRWVGHELSLHTVWLYFEYLPDVDGPGEILQFRTIDTVSRARFCDHVRIENRCLFDVRPEADHFVTFRCGPTIRQGHCSRVQPMTDFSESQIESAGQRGNFHAAELDRTNGISLPSWERIPPLGRR